MFEAAERFFDDVALPLCDWVEGMEAFCGGHWRYDDLGSPILQEAAQVVGVVAFVSDEAFGRHGDGEQRPGAMNICGLA